MRNKLGEVEKVLQKHTKDEDSGAPELPRFLEHHSGKDDTLIL